MPCDYKKYPNNWKDIRNEILVRDKNCCKFCGVENKNYGYRDKDGKFYDYETIDDALHNVGYDYFEHELKNCYDKKGNPTNPITIVLTIAHLDHDIKNNNYNNLAALCQRCHLNHDRVQHKESRQRNKGIIKLF